MTESAKKAAHFIQSKIRNMKPKFAMTLGSGLGSIAELIEDPIVISYKDLPDFPPCTVIGHAGNLYIGHLLGVPVICLQGRAHFYEGINPIVAKTYIRTLKLIGCESILLTNACGSMRPHIKTGDLVLVRDHINFQFTNVLVGINENEFGERFTNMQDAYDPVLAEKIKTIAQKNQIPLCEGIYVGVLGPSFETPAEIHAFQQMGGDIVAMSLINEVITARHCGLRVAAISAVSNMAAGLTQERISHELTLEGVKGAAEKLKKLVLEFVKAY